MLALEERELKRLVERVSDSILEHRDEVSGRYSSSPHLYYKEIMRNEDGSYTIRYYSKGGFFHNCWIEARISKDGIVTFNHCGDEGMKELVRKVRRDIEFER